jgi:hypothetical protein
MLDPDDWDSRPSKHALVYTTPSVVNALRRSSSFLLAAVPYFS